MEPERGCARRAARPIIVGVTGGIASGKTTVIDEFRRLGAVGFSADAIAREILEPGGAAFHDVVRAFGSAIVGPDGALDRAALAARIFGDPSARRRLNAMTHPRILDELDREFRSFRAKPPNDPPVAVAEIPLLYETGAERLVDGVVVAALEPQQQFTRLKQRTSWPDSRVWEAVHSQLPLDAKIARADWVIRTDGERDAALVATRAVWKEIIQLVKEDSPCP